LVDQFLWNAAGKAACIALLLAYLQLAGQTAPATVATVMPIRPRSPDPVVADLPMVIATIPALPAITLADLARRAVDYARQTSFASTRMAYVNDWADFACWCISMGLDHADGAGERTYRGLPR
jgi:hypothetical protein